MNLLTNYTLCSGPCGIFLKIWKMEQMVYRKETVNIQRNMLKS